MPLLPGSSEKVIQNNIRLLITEGKPREQAIAIALERAKKKRRPGQKSKETGPFLLLRKAIKVMGPGGKGDHRHTYDDRVSGLSSRTLGHRHPVVVNRDGTITIGRADGHVHPVV